MKRIICLALALAMLFGVCAEVSAETTGLTFNANGFAVRSVTEKDEEYKKGVAAMKRKDYDSAFIHFKKSALAGYACGQYEYAACLENGRGTSRNYQRCFEYYSYAAEQGFAPAIAAVGRCYLWGHGVKRNKDKAFDWFALSAAKDCALGQLWLGYCFEKGIGTSKDREQARTYYQLAADNGNKAAQKRLKKLG